MSGLARRVGQGLDAARPARVIEPGVRVHVVGAAGAGASAAALLADAAGAVVSGCDPGAPSPYTDALGDRGIDVIPAHDAGHVVAVEVPPQRLAVTKALTAVQPDHPELVVARERGIPVEPWQQLVADAAMSQRGRLVAVSGTHGKSTSAGWLVHLLVASGHDPGAFVGALLPAALTGGRSATARWGGGDVFVVEADEYAGNFDAYRPSIAIVLNADWDHPDVFPDRAAVVDAFETWLRAPGAQEREAIINVGDAGGHELAMRLGDWDDRVTRVAPVHHHDVDASVRYEVRGQAIHLTGLPDIHEVLVAPVSLPGLHNAANAACVGTAAARIGLSAVQIADGLASFKGVGRRLDIRGEAGGVLVIDDYGHHPTAISATIEAVRGRYPGRPIWVAHEPLTFHRAAAMTDALALSLADADHVVIADIWAGRDPDTTIASAELLASAVAGISGNEVVAPGSVEATADYLFERVQAGDIVLAMGGGRSYVIAERLLAQLGEAGAE